MVEGDRRGVRQGDHRDRSMEVLVPDRVEQRPIEPGAETVSGGARPTATIVPRMKVIIVGCGRVGARLAQQLDADGHRVAVVDMLPAAFNRLGRDFGGDMIVGNCIDEAVLRRAGIEGADCFVSVTNGDNRNLMAAQIAQRIFKVPRVITRVYDPIRDAVYRERKICCDGIAISSGGTVSHYAFTSF